MLKSYSDHRIGTRIHKYALRFDWLLCFALDEDGTSRVNAEKVLEERDPQFDAMLNQMVGRIRSKPGGAAEMGDVSKQTIDLSEVFIDRIL